MSQTESTTTLVAVRGTVQMLLYDLRIPNESHTVTVRANAGDAIRLIEMPEFAQELVTDILRQAEEEDLVPTGIFGGDIPLEYPTTTTEAQINGNGAAAA